MANNDGNNYICIFDVNQRKALELESFAEYVKRRNEHLRQDMQELAKLFQHPDLNIVNQAVDAVDLARQRLRHINEATNEDEAYGDEWDREAEETIWALLREMPTLESHF